jgi:hypothetical protein
MSEAEAAPYEDDVEEGARDLASTQEELTTQDETPALQGDGVPVENDFEDEGGDEINEEIGDASADNEVS